MSKKIKLSASRINTFLSCRQKYWFNYIQKIPKLSNPSFKLGLAVHESLELAGSIWKEKEKFTKSDKEKIFALYDQISIREGIEDYAVHVEGKDLVKKRLSNFMTGKKIIALEQKFGFRGEEGGLEIVSKYGVPILGAIDKTEEVDQDTLIIIDYKTSKTAPTPSQLKHDIQLSMYDLAARQMYPQYKRIILALDMLKSEVLYTYRTDEEREDFELYLKEIYDEMLSLREEEVKPNLHMFCPWCDFCNICSAFKKICEKTNYSFSPVTQYSNEKLISEWESVKATKKILETRERELGMVIMEKIKKDSDDLRADNKEVYIRQNSRTEYNLKEVSTVVPSEDLVSIVNLNKKAVESYMDANPSVKERIAETSTTNFTSPFLAVRKIKNKKN
jgi:RecB family exonuclease